MKHTGKPGRPTECTPELTSKVCEVIAQGNYRSVAARACGIRPTLLRQWMHRGRREDEGVFRTFLNAVLDVEAQTECKIVAQVVQNIPTNSLDGWKWLAARYPQRWSRDSERIRRLEELVERLYAGFQNASVPAPHIAQGGSPPEGGDRV